MFKKIISMLLIVVCSFSFAVGAFANFEEEVNSIDEYLSEYDQMMEKEGYTLVDRSIEVVNPRVKRSIIIGSGSLTNYNGYKMRYVKVCSQFNRNPEVISEGRAVASALNTGFNVAVGFVSAWVWVPCTLLGVNITDFGGSANDMLTSQVNLIDTQIIVEIEDKDNKYPNKEFYPVSTTNSIAATNTVTLSAMNKYGNFVSKTGITKRSAKSNHYANYYWMQKMGYENYKYGNSDAFERLEK